MSDSQEPPSSPAGALIAELLDEGEVLDEGGFTLDPAAAAAKLDAFAYADRGRYLVPLVEGLLGLGATAVAIDRTRGDVELRASGIRLASPEAALTDLYGYAIGRGEDPTARALGRLAVGLDMVLGADGTEAARVRYSGASEAFEAELRHRAGPRVAAVEIDVIGELRILVDFPRLGGDAVDHERAVAELRDAVGHAEAEIRIDGVRVSGVAREWWRPQTGAGEGFRFTAGLTGAGVEPGIVELWSAGVCVERLASEGVGFVGVVELERARYDLSQVRIVRDELVERALAAVEAARLAALAALAEADADWGAGDRPRAWPRARVDRVLGRVDGERGAGLRPQAPEVPLGPLALTWAHADDGCRPLVGMLLLIGAGMLSFGVVIEYLSEPEPGGWLLGVCVVAVALAGVMFAPTYALARRAIAARDHGVRTLGRVIGFEQIERGREDYPTPARGRVHWVYTDERGTEHAGVSLRRAAAEEPSWPAGATIVVFHDPARPGESWAEVDVGPRG